jgi:hypothetical protein
VSTILSENKSNKTGLKIMLKLLKNLINSLMKLMNQTIIGDADIHGFSFIVYMKLIIKNQMQ